MQGAVVDLAGQMGDMILASRSYQANMSVFKEARDALETHHHPREALIDGRRRSPPIGSIGSIERPAAHVGDRGGVGSASSATCSPGASTRCRRWRAKADALTASFAAGGNVQIYDVMAATSKANLGMTITNEIRNKALEAYQSIINIQV